MDDEKFACWVLVREGVLILQPAWCRGTSSTANVSDGTLHRRTPQTQELTIFEHTHGTNIVCRKLSDFTDYVEHMFLPAFQAVPGDFRIATWTLSENFFPPVIPQSQFRTLHTRGTYTSYQSSTQSQSSGSIVYSATRNSVAS